MSLEKPSPPAADQENPYIPSGPPPQVFEDFEGINTSVPRMGVPDQQMAWCDGFIPVGKRNLRALYGKGTLLYTAPGGLTIKFYKFYFLSKIQYGAVFLSDGSIVQVRVPNGTTVSIAPAGTIQNPSIVNVGFCQYGQQYLIIVANQNNGYFIWDGTLLYAAGQISPVVTLTNVGAAYKTVPRVTASGGSGGGAHFVATIAGGVVTNVVVTNAGSGYLPGETITLNFSGGNSAGSGGSLTAVLSGTGGGTGANFTVNFVATTPAHYVVDSITVNSGGSGYSQFTVLNLTVTNINQIIASAVLVPVISGGIITSVAVINAGNYYSQLGTPVGTLAAIDSGAFTVTSVTVNAGGSNYSPSATATCSGGGSPIAQATLQLVLVGGSISSVTVADGGLYGSNVAPNVNVSDAKVNAAAFAQLMPFGVQGTAVETYAGHVWVVNGPVVNATAPGSPVDFAISNGGVSFESNSSHLKSGYTQLISTNGLLLLVGDSSTDYISGVTTSGVPPTTTFSFLNADPETGTPYPATVLPFGNLMMLANGTGVYQLAGSTFTKVSDVLDGTGLANQLWFSVTNFGNNQLCAAKAHIFSKKVWMVLITVLDPISNAQVNKLFMWDGAKWWASMQDLTLTYIATAINQSIFTAYGTDGTSIYPLFRNPAPFTKVVQSKLWDAPIGYTHVKASVRLFGAVNMYQSTAQNFTISVDNENGPNASPTNVVFGSTGYIVGTALAIAQQGSLTGLTFTTQAENMSLISFALQNEVVGYKG